MDPDPGDPKHADPVQDPDPKHWYAQCRLGAEPFFISKSNKMSNFFLLEKNCCCP